MTSRSFALSVALSAALFGCASPSTHESPRKSGPMLNRKQHGLWTYTYANGQMQAQGRYLQDRQVDRWTYWYENGAKEWEVSFAAERFEGPSQWWWPNGKPRAYGAFTEGLEIGAYTYWSDDGAIAQQGEFDLGRASSSWTAWFPDGQPKASGFFWRGERVGAWEFFAADGTAYVHNFALPEGVSVHRELWDDGTPRREGVLERGLRSGRWSTRHENGVRRTSGAFRDGKAHGAWCFYRPDGTLLATAEFAEGHLARDMRGFDGGKAAAISRGSFRPLDTRGLFSLSSEAAGRPVADVVSTWFSEATSQLGANQIVPLEAAPEPPAELFAELSRKTSLPLHAQPWTVSEEANMNFLVQLYTDGAPNIAAPPGGGQYGGGPRGARGGAKRVKEGDIARSSPLIGRKLGFAEARTRDGGKIDLHTLEGKPLVLVILRGMAGEICVYCYTQVRALCDTMPSFAEAGANVVVVYPGDADRLELFWNALRESEEFEGREAPFTFAYDPEFALVRALSIEGNLALPTTLVIDPDGTIRFAYVGADSADRPDAQRLLEQVRGLAKP